MVNLPQPGFHHGYLFLRGRSAEGFSSFCGFFLGLISWRKSWPAADVGKGGDSERKKDRDRKVV